MKARTTVVTEDLDETLEPLALRRRAVAALHLDGCNEAAPSMSCIETYARGIEVDLATPTPAMVEIDDIAWALAGEPRYANHTPYPWPVGAHSLVVSALVEQDAERDHWDSLRGLLHDSPEAYLKDLPGPLKKLPELAGYCIIERRFEVAIAARFGLPGLSSRVVKRADEQALVMEQVLIRKKPSAAAASFRQDVVTLLRELYGAPQATVRVRFLRRFEDLRDAIARQQ